MTLSHGYSVQSVTCSKSFYNAQKHFLIELNDVSVVLGDLE